MVQQISHAQYYIYVAFRWLVFGLALWAAIDCGTRKAAAFTAAGKLTKPTWMLMTVLSALVAFPYLWFPDFLLMIVGTVSAVYLADVRPAVREISGPQRW